MFNRIVREGDSLQFQNWIEKYANTSLYNTNLDLIKSLYKSLQKQYRCEYVYKNNLVSKLIKEHNIKHTIILNELKIGASKADLVMLNGSVRVFEIKTELDDFSKLMKQLGDYQKFAEEVNIVTDEKSAQKLLELYSSSNVGIIILDDKNKLTTLKEASSDYSFFEFDTIFKVLRKNEYIDLVNQNFGIVPDVPNTKIFKECYKLLANIDIYKFQKQVLQKLKERKLRNPELLKSNNTPKELKHICNSLDFNKKEYNLLYNFLESEIVCTCHI